MDKIGLMGGTFNPIHHAHLKLAEAAMREHQLDKVLFLTSGNPPHKQDEQILDKFIRHRMVELATAPYAGFIPCDYEVRKETYSYTVHTLQYLNTQYPKAQLYFIIGADSLHHITSWYKPEEIVKQCTLLVYPRNGYDVDADIERIRALYQAEILKIDAELEDVSSTEIRERVAEGKDVSSYVPVPVDSFIKKYDLYRMRQGSMEERLSKMLSPSRFAHSLGVRDTAVKMAQIFGADIEQAALVGLLHDCGKGFSVEEQMEQCRDLGVELDLWEQENPKALAHAKLGAMLVRCLFDVSDEAVCEAIRWHTLGRVGMSMLEKIIYVADMVEPNRAFPGVEHLRALAFSDLDRAVYECVNQTIQFNESRGNQVHPNAYKLRASLE